MKYRKLPVVIEATQYSPPVDKGYEDTQWDEVGRIANELQVDRKLLKEILSKKEIGRHLVVKTLEGEEVATPGYWIIKGIEGEVYPCANSIFKKTYEKVSVTEELSTKNET